MRRWRRLAEAERAACRETVVALVLRLGHAAVASPSPEATLQAEKVYGVLGQLLRAAWPDGWPGFVPEPLGGALPPPVALRILGLLADEALPPRGAAATPRAARARACLAAQASPILQACAEPLVQQNGGASGDELRALALGALASLAPWLPPAAVLQACRHAPLPSLLDRAATRRPALALYVTLCDLDASIGPTLAAALAAIHAALPPDGLRGAAALPRNGWGDADIVAAAEVASAAWTPLAASGEAAAARAASDILSALCERASAAAAAADAGGGDDDADDAALLSVLVTHAAAIGDVDAARATRCMATPSAARSARRLRCSVRMAAGGGAGVGGRGRRRRRR